MSSVLLVKGGIHISCCDSPQVGRYIPLQTQLELEIEAGSLKRAVDIRGLQRKQDG